MNTKEKITPKKTDSFGEYFDTQYENLRKMMDNPNRKQYVEYWEEREKEKQNEKQRRRN